MSLANHIPLQHSLGESKDTRFAFVGPLVATTPARQGRPRPDLLPFAELAPQHRAGLAEIAPEQGDTCTRKAVGRDADDGFDRSRGSTGISHLGIVGGKSLIALSVIELDVSRFQAETGHDAHIKDKSEFEAIAQAAQAVTDRLKPIEEELIQVKWKAKGDDLFFPARLNAKLAGLSGRIASGDTAPTAAERAVFEDVSTRVQAQLDQLSETVVTEVGNLNEAIRKSELGAVGA